MSLPKRFCSFSHRITLLAGLLMLFTAQPATAQKQDTSVVHLDENLLFTNKKNRYFPAISIQQGDHWKLIAVYPDTARLLEATYADASLRVKDGHFILYHPNHIKAMEGHYQMNRQEGVWRYWHANGILKDSGNILHDILSGEWRSFDASGNPMTLVNYVSPTIANAMDAPKKPSYYAPSIFSKDTLIKLLDGRFTSYYENGRIKEQGIYQQNLRDGRWVTYYPTGIPESEGDYTKDQQTGSWTYYYENGTASTKEQYQNNQITSLECYDTTGIASGNYCSIVKPPVPLIGRFENFRDHLLDHVFWPKELSDKNVNGIVQIRCTIDKTGILSTFEVLRSPHELLSKEVERYFRSIEQWSPAISHNRPISYSFEMEIPFIR